MKSTLITSATGAILLGLLMSPFTVSADPHQDLPPGLQKKGAAR